MTLGELIEKLKILAEDNRIPLDSEVEYTTGDQGGYETQLLGADTFRRYEKLVVKLTFQEHY